MLDSITIQRLVPELRETYLEYFDNDAFADNAGWAGCYCYFPHANHGEQKWSVRSSAENRSAAASMIESGAMQGYLALIDGRPVGWCSANSRDRYTIFDGDERDPARIGVIACFVVAESQRGKGVATSLLAAAIDGFRAQGLDVVEAYPLPDASTSSANHFGPLAMYLRAGFEVVGKEDNNLVVRLGLV